MAMIIVILALVVVVQVITIAVAKANYNETIQRVEQGCEKQGEFVLNGRIYKCKVEVPNVR